MRGNRNPYRLIFGLKMAGVAGWLRLFFVLDLQSPERSDRFTLGGNTSSSHKRVCAATVRPQYLVGWRVSVPPHQKNHPYRRKPVFLLVAPLVRRTAMGKRPAMRAGGKRFNLFAPYDEACDWIRVRRVSFAEGERMCRLGEWSRVNDANNEHAGYEILHREEWNGYVSSESPRAISASEMALYAGRAFRFGRSRTSGLTEKQRLARRDERTGLPLPPEDVVERIVAKVEYFGQHRLVA